MGRLSSQTPVFKTVFQHLQARKHLIFLKHPAALLAATKPDVLPQNMFVFVPKCNQTISTSLLHHKIKRDEHTERKSRLNRYLVCRNESKGGSQVTLLSSVLEDGGGGRLNKTTQLTLFFDSWPRSFLNLNYAVIVVITTTTVLFQLKSFPKLNQVVLVP